MLRNKKIIIAALIIVIVLCGVIVAIASQKPSQSNEGVLAPPTSTTSNSSNDSSTPDSSTSTNTNTPSETDFKSAITADTSYLKDPQTGQPTFSIISQTSPQPNWYILKLRLNTVSTSDATIALQDQGGKTGLKVILGPGTSFSPEMTSGLPDKVREALSQ